MKKHWHCFINYSQHYLGLSAVTERGLKAGSLATGEKLVHLDKLNWCIIFNTRGHAILNIRENLFGHRAISIYWLWVNSSLHFCTFTVIYLEYILVSMMHVHRREDKKLFHICTFCTTKAEFLLLCLCLLTSVTKNSVSWFAEYYCGINLNTPYLIYYYLYLFPAAAITQFPHRGN